MKKLSMAVLLISLISFTSVSAQEESDVLMNKNGKVVLPEAGDYAIGINAAPFLSYVGGFLSNAGASAPSFTSPGGFTVYGKMFISENTAYRAKVNFDISRRADNTFVMATPTAAVADQKESTITTSIDIDLQLGLEKRIGKSRIQGFYGASGVIGYNNGGVTTIKHDLATSSTYPASGSFNPKTKPGATFSLGAQGFAGVEYFVAPKVSIAGEIAYSAGLEVKGKGKIVTEKWDASSNSISTTETAGTISSNTIGLKGIPTGSLILLFHF